MGKNIKKWLKEICRWDKDGWFIEVVVDEGEGTKKEYRSKFRCRFYTRDHKYAIVAIDRSKDDGYLGCTVTARKPRAGEDWTRGNDLPDGPYAYETWLKIKNAIIAYELVKVAKKQSPEADVVKEA